MKRLWAVAVFIVRSGGLSAAFLGLVLVSCTSPMPPPNPSPKTGWFTDTNGVIWPNVFYSPGNLPTGERIELGFGTNSIVYWRTNDWTETGDPPYGKARKKR